MWTLPRAYSILPPILILLASASPLVSQQNNKPQREQIGEVLGTPVYRDEIRTGENVQLRNELHRLFTSPILEQYLQKHKNAITPTQAEINTAMLYFNRKHDERIKGEEAKMRERLEAVEEKLTDSRLTEEEISELEFERSSLRSQLEPPGRSFALFMLKNRKFQRHLYDEYGGGRILWQQAGLEAFDAMHQWLKSQEQNGKFAVNDPMLRTVFYEYWTTMGHGAFLTDDQERIRNEFLEPDWLPAASPED